MEKLENLKNNKYFPLMVTLLFGLFNAALACSQFTSKLRTMNKMIVILLIIVLIGLHVGFYYLIKYFLKKDIKIEKLFLVLISIIGTAYLFIIPIGWVPDESAHFFRAYEITEGHIISEKNEANIGGGEYPTEFSEVLQTSLTPHYIDVIEQLKLTPGEETAFIKYAGSSLYSPLSYIPQVIGIFIGKIITPSIVIHAYCGRIINMICCILIMFLAFKILPCFKRFFLLCAFLPMVMQQMISLSPDGITFSLAFLFLAYILKLRKEKEKKIEKKDIGILTGIATVLSICKIVYLPLCLLAFLIPETKFTKKKNKYITIGCIAIFILAINLLWLSIASTYLVEFHEGVNSMNQVMFILNKPIQYIVILISTISGYITDYLFTLVGSRLEWLSVSISSLYVLFTLLLMGHIGFQDHDSKTEIDFTTKFIIGIVSIITILLIFTSLYVQWTPVGNTLIFGIQGRYFIPLLLFIPCLLYNKKRKINDPEKYTKFILMFMIGFNLYTLCVLFLTHI